MGGICAVYSRTGGVIDKDLLQRLARAMSHRGEVRAECAQSAAALAAVQASLGEEPVAAMPFYWKPGRCWIATDSRLDNRAELVRTLQGHGVSLAEESDAELIAASYGTWGTHCCDRIQGDFAFVLWDEDRRVLLGARDPMGSRPFVYHYNGRRLICASEPRQILEDPSVSRDLDETWVAWWLARREGHWSGTPYREILELLPGDRIIADKSGLRVEQFWRAQPRQEIRYRSPEEYAEHFRLLFFESVRSRLPPDGPLLFDLSGGLDSSSVVCAAAALREQGGDSRPIHCIHWYSGQAPDEDDRGYAQMVADRHAIHLIWRSFDDHRSLTAASDLLPWTNAPTVTTLLYLHPRQEQWRIMAQLGTKVAMTGCFGDHLMSGRHTYLSEYLSDWRPIALLRELLLWRRTEGYPMGRTLRDWALRPLVRRRSYRSYDPRIAPWIRPQVWGHFRQRRAMDAAYFRRQCPDPLARALLRGLREHTNCTMTQADEMLLAGIETREPFLDRRLVEFMLAVPPEFQVRPDQPRLLQRVAMKGVLPEGIRQRQDKGGASSTVYRGIAEHRNELKELVRRAPDLVAPYLDSERLIEKIDRVALGDAGGLGLVGALLLIIWSHRLPWAGGLLPQAGPSAGLA